jgi:hypothetical protein
MESNKMNNTLLQWEIEWVQKNQHLYDGPMHAKAVIGNIKKRYWIAEVKKRISQFEQTKTTASYQALFDFNRK